MANEGNNKVIRGESKPLYNLDYTKNVEVGEVVSVTDPNYLGRIKVRVKGSPSNGGDDGVSDANLPWAFPMIPKFLSTQPKVKEAVFVFVFSKNKEHVDRMYLGPIISQPQQLNFDPFYFTALRGFSFSSEYPDVDVATIPNIKGVFPNPEDVSIQGRYNTDITQKNNEIVIRAGKFETITPDKNNPLPFRFNSKTQAYIQIKNDVVTVKGTDKIKEERGSVTNIVSNKINLLTHKNGSPIFNLTNQDNLISDDELSNILENAHPISFGDIMVKWMVLCQDAIFNHVHNGNGNPATDLVLSGNKQSLQVFKEKTDTLIANMLSKNIRIN
jgi:hypothetical protein